MGGLVVTLIGLAFIYPDYVTLRHQRGTFAALSARLHTQQAHFDALEGQKTGAFLDQRENYAAAAEYAHGKALDVF